MRRQDIASWEEVDVSKLRSKERKRFKRAKSALVAYFTTDEPVGEIVQRYRISRGSLESLAETCLLQHEDGKVWGFRALFPRVTVIDHSVSSEQISTPKEDNEVVVKSDNGTSNAISEDDVIASLFGEVRGQSTDEDKLNGDGEETEKRQAVKPPLEGVEGQESKQAETSTGRSRKGPQGIATTKDEVEDVGDLEILPVEETEDEEGDATTAAVEEVPASVNEAAPERVSEEGGEEISPVDDKTAEGQTEGDVAEKEMLSLVDEREVTLEEVVPLTEEQERTTGEDEKTTEEIVSAEETGMVADEATTDARSMVGATLAVALARGRPDRSRPVGTVSSISLELLLYEKSKYRLVGKKLAQARRLVHKRVVREVREQQRKRHFQRVVCAVVVAAILFMALLPLGAGLAAYEAYNNIRGLAYDGVNHLLNVKSVLTFSKSDPTAALNVGRLQKARNEFGLAEGDFVQLLQLVSRSDVRVAIEQFAPQYGSKLDMAQRLVQVGLDVSRMGREMSDVALIGANLIHGSPLASNSTKPLISTTDVANAEGALVHALYYIDDIQSQMSQVSLKDLPISDKQKAQLNSMLPLLPKAKDMIMQAQGLIGMVAWLLGVGQQRRFLVQTMDRAEVRPSGGFTGQYGVLEIQDGRMAPFSLHDVNDIDYNGNGVELGRPAPPEYRSWMNFGNWGLRDSNLSADYPTTARLSMQVFQDEGGGPVDGDISFTPVLISDILSVTGPIRVAQYNETITSLNLEERLHYYQQNNSGIITQEKKTGVNSVSARKTFTTLLGRLLLDRVRHLQVKQLLALWKVAVKDIQSRDLEIYFTNPDAETWLVAHGYSAGMNTFTKYDGFMVVQANISVSKASQYVHTTEQDQITLDAQGGATHVLTITLDYSQTGPVYGYDTYADYIRVYAPASAQFLWGDGFDTGQVLCTPTTTVTPTPSPTPGGTGSGTAGNSSDCAKYKTMPPSPARYCPNGNYDLGQRGYIIGKGFINWPIDNLGGPTALTSDIPGRSMWGGLTETPKNCTSYITLSWYVPHVVRNVAGQSSYALLVQKQGGYIPTVQISVDTSAAPIKGLKPFDFSGDLTADRVFALPVLKKK